MEKSDCYNIGILNSQRFFFQLVLRRILMHRPIVFANDEMAFSGYRVCEKRGLKVDKDILITGFDDYYRNASFQR